jgi:hypothetical protein
VKFPWKDDDPYWDAFVNRPPADPNNLLPHAFKQVPEGGVNPVRTEVHSPNIMASHVKELGRFYGADLVGIIERVGADPPFAIISLLRADHDTRTAHGIGGQTPALKGTFATFTLSAYIRELGYRCARSDAEDAERLALAAGLGQLDADGRLVSHRYGRKVHVADVLLTDLPLEPDGQFPLPMGEGEGEGRAS